MKTRHSLPTCHYELACAVTLFALTGCGGAYDATAYGTVTVNGERLSSGTVAFNPVSPGPPALGAVNSDSTYTIKTGLEDGLPPGDYVVTVIASERNLEIPAGGGPPVPGKMLTPLEYSAVSTSDLRFTVEPGENEITLELKGDVRDPKKQKSRRRRR